MFKVFLSVTPIRLNDYPQCQTQGFSQAELIENLKDLLHDIESGGIPESKYPAQSFFSDFPHFFLDEIRPLRHSVKRL